MSITLAELTEIILIESGQFIAPLEATLLDKSKLILMIKRELALYSRYLPNKVSTVANLSHGKVFNIDTDGYVPDNIIDIRTDRFAFMGYSVTPLPAPVHAYYWRYEKPTLYFRYPDGVYPIKYISEHVYNVNTDSISSINIQDRFINLLIGRFLMSVGRSRKAFTIDELPISSDAADMISTGKELYDSTMEEIRQMSMFNAAILV